MKYLLTFLEGLASFISPCILPLVPIYISYFMGADETSSKTKKAFINSLFFVLGSSLIFILMALLASTLGIWIAEYDFIIKVVFGFLLILLGFDYIGIIKIKIPNLSSNINYKLNNLNIFRSFIFGILFSISHTPCTGAFLAGALALITKEQDIFKGVLLMVLYSIGLGIPFIISVLLIEKAKNVFNFIKKHYKIIKIASGIILIVTGIYLIAC